MSAAHESRRKQATAIVMMGVIGAEFGASLECAASTTTSEKSNVAEGFGLANYTHARHTSMFVFCRDAYGLFIAISYICCHWCV